MRKNLFILFLSFTVSSIILPTPINNNKSSVYNTIQQQVASNNHIDATTFHAVPLVSMVLPAGLLFFAADRLSNGDVAGAGGAAFMGLLALDYTKVFYLADKKAATERLEQNERLIKEQAKLEKE